MQHGKSHFSPGGKSAFAVLLIALVLLLNAMAASEPLHKLIHHDADKADHDCAVTMFTHGHVDAASGDVPVAVPRLWIETAPSILFSVPGTAIENLPPGRGPPAFPAVS